MTPKQSELLDFIKAYTAEHACSPSFEEMMHGLGLKSKAGVHRLLAVLKEQGLISRKSHRSRTVVVLDYNLDHIPTSALVAALEARGIVLGAKAW